MSLPSGASDLIRAALAEDIGAGDWTTLWTVPAELKAIARIQAKTPGVVSGLDVACHVFRSLDSKLEIREVVSDGEAVAPGQSVLEIRGSARTILSAERVALNFLQRLSGVSTLTRRYVEAVAGTGTRILDTRKTTPVMRAMERRAVLAGGGVNHRFGLNDMVLIKENHIAAAGGVRAAVEAVRARNDRGLAIEVETTSLSEVDDAIGLEVDRILLDNMDLSLLSAAVERIRAHSEPRPETEASGGVSLATVRSVAETGVDFVSVGAITHSAPALDLSLLIESDRGR